MPFPKSKRIALLLLFVYAAGLLFVAPHVDLDGISGSGRTQLAAHADADNCKHIPVSHLDSCPLCASVEGRAVLTPSPLALEVLNTARPIQFSAASTPYSHILLTSFSRRGPPSLLS
jgi:hypothetical protein